MRKKNRSKNWLMYLFGLVIAALALLTQESLGIWSVVMGVVAIILTSRFSGISLVEMNEHMNLDLLIVMFIAAITSITLLTSWLISDSQITPNKLEIQFVILGAVCIGYFIYLIKAKRKSKNKHQ